MKNKIVVLFMAVFMMVAMFGMTVFVSQADVNAPQTVALDQSTYQFDAGFLDSLDGVQDPNNIWDGPGWYCLSIDLIPYRLVGGSYQYKPGTHGTPTCIAMFSVR